MKPAPASCILMGLRGSGKSTIAGLLARRLGVPAIDLDERVLETLGGTSVTEVWTSRGEAAFRAAETQCLEEALRDRRTIVLALGGGAPTAPGAAELLRRAVEEAGSQLIYLRARPETLRRRLEAAGPSDRPSLTGRGTLAEIETVFAARDARYRGLATRVIEVDDLDHQAVVEELVAELSGPRRPREQPDRTP